MTLLAAASVEAELDRLGAAVGRPLELVASTGSTNDDARAAAAAGASHGSAFLADEQTRGRGRGGHTWHSPAGESIYLSLVLRPDVKASSIAPATLAAGLAVARAVEAFVATPAAIKWPNDVLLGDRKIAGILVEGQLRGDRVASLVVGVGFNVHTTTFPEELARIATSLELAGARNVDRSLVAARLLFELGRSLSEFELYGLESILDELRKRDALFGCRVRVADAEGFAAGIDADGRFLIRDEAGVVHPILSGSIERLAPP